jgi:hypothetical protein
LVVPFFIFGSGCNNSSGDLPRDVTGTAVYRDASTNLDGTPHQAASPEPQDAALTVVVTGTGTLRDVAPPCAPDGVGMFVVGYIATMRLDDDAMFEADVDKTGAVLTTPAGCVIGSLTRGTITGIALRGSLPADATNCQAFCDARARVDAELQCSAATNADACRTRAQPPESAACQVTCTTQAIAIVGNGSVATAHLDALDGIDGIALRTGTIGTLSADLVFDQLADASENNPARSIDRREAQL